MCVCMYVYVCICLGVCLGMCGCVHALMTRLLCVCICLYIKPVGVKNQIYTLKKLNETLVRQIKLIQRDSQRLEEETAAVSRQPQTSKLCNSVE